jgi:HTH-type transcriptional regulator / antitoxin HigA
MRIATKLPKTLPTSFDGLVNVMVPHAIVDKADYGNVVQLMNRLAVMDARNQEQEQYLETLAQLVEAYDSEHYPINTSNISGMDTLKNLIADHGMSASDLGRILGNRALGAKVLNGTRELSKANMKALGEHFKIDPGVFLR